MVSFAMVYLFFFSSRRRHTRWPRDWSSDVCSSDLDHGRAHARPSPRSYLSVPDASDRIDFVRPGAPSDPPLQEARTVERSEERRVGKEWRGRRWTDQ